MRETKLHPASAVIAGLGRTGLSCARYLRARGWRIAVTDSRENPPELAALRELDPQITLRLGGLDASLLTDAACVVTSPGLSPEEPFFAEARRRGVEIVGDVELFALAVDAPVVGITGTNGKSTVTTLVGRMAQRAGLNVRVGGNLGSPALELLLDAQRDSRRTDLYVLELSSFQLETTMSLDLRVAAVLNVTADHLDRYRSLEHYAAAKARIFGRCDAAVINLDDPLVVAMAPRGARTLSFSLLSPMGADYCVTEPAGTSGWWLAKGTQALLPLSALKITGLHNAANALAALAIGEALALPLEDMLAELRNFPGLAHRSQWVASIDGVTYIDDSKGTNVGATLAAVAGTRGPVVLIAGGEGKGQDFSALRAAFASKVRAVVLIGRDADEIDRVLNGVCLIERAATLEGAVRAAARLARAGDTVLLSPACASLDMFRDYAHRGTVFSEAVRKLAA